MTVKNNVGVMKTLNSEAIMSLDLIRKLGLIYKLKAHKFEFEDTYKSKSDYQIASLIAGKEISSFQQEAVNQSVLSI
jgi:hypothetical protein